MKKFFGFFLMACVLLVTGCKDDLMPTGGNGEEVTVQFTIGTESAATARRQAPGVNYADAPQISDGSKANQLIYAVYDANGNLLEQFADNEGVSEGGTISKTTEHGIGQTVVDVTTFPVTLSFKLVRGQTYTFAFWAQSEDCDAYNTTDLKAVKVDYQNGNNTLCNYELRDAFCKSETFTVSSQTTTERKNIILRRPFAQINVGITKADYEAALKSNIRIKDSKIHIENVATELNVVSNSINVDGKDKLQAIDYTYNLIPAYINNGKMPEEGVEFKEEYLRVDMNRDGAIEEYGYQNDEFVDETYKYLLMCYVLPADRIEGTSTYSTTLDKVDITFRSDDGREIPLADGSLSNIPVQRNWRTNIVGTLLSSDVELIIDLDPIYSGDFNAPDYLTIAEGVSYVPDPEGDYIAISNGMGLQWFSDASNGKFTEANYGKIGNAALFLKAVNLEKWPDNNIFNFANTTIKLTNDVDFELANKIEGVRREWTPISYSATFEDRNDGAFCGTFDGGNHTISNLRTVRPVDIHDMNSYGLFGQLQTPAVVKNLRLFNIDIVGHYRAGAIAACAYAASGKTDGYAPIDIINCYVDYGTIICTPGIVNDATQEYNNANNIGGILGQFAGNLTLESCYVRNLTISGYRVVGGLIGTDNNEEWQTISISNNTVSDVILIADQFQPYEMPPYGWLLLDQTAGKTGELPKPLWDYNAGLQNYLDAKYVPRLDPFLGRNIKQPILKYENNMEYNVKRIPFWVHKIMGPNNDEYGNPVKGQSTRYANIADVDLQLVPRLQGDYAEAITIGSSLIGLPSAYKKYNKTTAGEEPDENSMRVGLYVKGLLVDGQAGNNGNVLDDYTVTVTNTPNNNVCALYFVTVAHDPSEIWKYNAIKNLAVHGNLYVKEGICIVPVEGATIELDNVSVYDAKTVLTDADVASQDNATLNITNSNFRGNIDLQKNYSSLNFENTVFESATDNSNTTLTVANAVNFVGCTFKAPYTINATNANFDDDCKAIGSNPEKSISLGELGITTGGTYTIILDEAGDPKLQ